MDETDFDPAGERAMALFVEERAKGARGVESLIREHPELAEELLRLERCYSLAEDVLRRLSSELPDGP